MEMAPALLVVSWFFCVPFFFFVFFSFARECLPVKVLVLDDQAIH